MKCSIASTRRYWLRDRRWKGTRTTGRLGRFLTGLLAGFSGLNAMGGPHGMSVQQGNVSSAQNGSRLDINASHNSVINWQSFNIGTGESVNFHQPNAVSVVWNRILDTQPSQIWGSINANGIVVLMNQNGFYFGPNSSINVGGFVATTAAFSPPAPMGSGMWQFTGTPPLASIVNYGEIKAQSGGSIFMVAEKIENHGVLSAPDGTLGLYAGKEVLISERPDARGLSASVRLPEGSIDNTGKLIADAGTIAMHAQVVNNNGLVQANSVRAQNGTIEFVASEKVELGADSLVQAKGDAAGVSDGGTIRIKAERTFADQAGSKIDVSVGAQGGNGGSVELSAPSMASLHSQLDGHAAPDWKGGDLFLDPADIILTTAEDATSTPSGTINAGDPPSSLRLNVNTAFANFSTIHLQATHDISLDPGTLWNLNDSTGKSDPGSMLTLEAGHNIVFGDNSRIVAGSGWSLRLAAGVDFSSPTLAVKPGVGSIYFNGGPPDANGAKPDGSGAIETFAGAISLEAGHDILVGSGFVRTSAGGSIEITTGDGDVDAGTRHDIYHTYDFNTRGYTISQGDLGGIGTTLGGNVTIHSGRDILAFIAPIGTFAPGGLFGGGDAVGEVNLTAAHDIKGHFMLRNGAGMVHAGGDVGSASSPVSLGLTRGGWTVAAGWDATEQAVVRGQGDLYLDEVFNPNGSLNEKHVNAFGGPRSQAFQFDYAPDAYANLSAGNSVQLLGNDLAHLFGNSDRPAIYAPKLDIKAGAGGVVLGNDLVLAPSALGSLSISTTDGGSLRSTERNFYQLVMSDSGSLNYKEFVSGHAAGTPLHFNSHDDAVNLDIAGDIQNLFLRVPRQADITVHGGALNFTFEGQNLSPDDRTTLKIDQDYFSRSDRTFVSPTDLKMENFILLTDPLQAVNPDLGGRLTYNNGQLIFQGVMTAAERDFLLHPVAYQLDPKTHLVALDASGNPIIGPVPFTTDSAAIQDLFARSQDIPTSPLARNGLQIGGPGSFEITARNMDLGISAGIRSVGVQLNHALAAVSYLGANLDLTLGSDLQMASSQIASFSGGDIDVKAAGKLNVGSSEQLTSDDTPKGIYTGHGGHVIVQADGDIDINGSRIASYDGGNIEVTSDHGNIDAGSGGKGFFTVTTTQLDPLTGLPADRNDKFFGSGIVALTRPDSDVKVGDITVSAGMKNPLAHHDEEHPELEVTGIGSIIANAGGILQLAFNAADQSEAKVTLTANGDIKANQSGILGGTVKLDAGENIDGLIVARGNLGITAQQNVNVTALAGGLANVGAGGNISGNIVGGVGATATGAGTIDATIISTSGSGGASAFANVAAPVAQQTTTESEKKAITAATDTEDEEEKKKRAAAQAPVLAKTTGRVTVILPTK